MRRSKDNLMLT